MRRVAFRALAFTLLLAAGPSCAAIVGDDFKIDENGDEKGSSTTGDPCAGTECDPCLQNSCPNEYNACAPGTDCYTVLKCLAGCGEDEQCSHDCQFDEAENQRPGVNELIAFASCACQGACTEVCTKECVC